MRRPLRREVGKGSAGKDGDENRQRRHNQEFPFHKPRSSQAGMGHISPTEI